MGKEIAAAHDLSPGFRAAGSAPALGLPETEKNGVHKAPSSVEESRNTGAFFPGAMRRFEMRHFLHGFSVIGQCGLLLLACAGLAQPTSELATLRGNVHALARPESDVGPADPRRVLNHISIHFKPSPERRAELDRLLADQQDPSSPRFHEWLTPEQFGERFGMSPADFDGVSRWLRSAGLQVTAAAAARNWVAFDGSVDSVQRAFRTQIRQYRAGGETHFANASEPSVPAEFAPLVTYISGLNDFHLTPAGGRIQTRESDSPEYTSGIYHVMVPDDFAMIYDVQHLYSGSWDGTGQSLAILGESDISLVDITSFRTVTGLPTIQLQRVLVPGVPDPGHVVGAESEADLALEWSGAVARNANIVYVYAPNVWDALQYALSPPLGSALPGTVVGMSYGGCEAQNGGMLPALESLVIQGNAQGVTFIAASGDSGAAGCDRAGTSPVAVGGLAVEVPASVPEATAVGGTMFNEGIAIYWNTSNSSTGESALRYIPEMAWNESGAGGLSASGGGVSTAYAKPAWQVGVAGVPAANFRAVPDVAIAAGAAHDGYLWVSSGDPAKPQCMSPVNRCSSGGTSAAAAAFAGIVTILNQYAASMGPPSLAAGLGNINPALYKLFSTTPNAFHDIGGGNNLAKCQSGSTGCGPTGSYGYNSGVGYDLVTGLGSVDAYNLVTEWYGRTVAPSTTTLTAFPTAFPAEASTTLGAKVTGGGGTPSGTVTFQMPGKTLGTATLSAGAASLNVSGSQFAAGQNAIAAIYGGDANFGGSSAMATVTVTVPANASAVVPVVGPNPVPLTPNATGSGWFFTMTLAETAGKATTLTGLSIGGTDYTPLIASLFGTASIGAKGAISASTSLAAKLYTPPATVPFVFSGVDSGGMKWTQSASVTLVGPQAQAAMSLTSAPATVYQNPASANCPWPQNLQVQELNGYGVSLTRFLAAGQDLSPQILTYFGSTGLAPFGSLQAYICWPGISPPQTMSYELDGVDGNGNAIKGSGSVAFASAPLATSALALSKSSLALQLASASGTTSATIAVNVPLGVAWSVATFPANQGTAWLTVVPAAGLGPGSVTVTASGSGLSNSVFNAMLAFQAAQAVPPFLNVPVTLTIGSHPVVINVGGVVPVDSGSSTIQPGSWVSIYGKGLAAGTAVWNGDFPTTLGGVSVMIDGKAAYLWYVSPTQINLQAPADTATGPVNVLVVNSNGSATATVTLSQQGPAFLLLGDGAHAAGIIYTPKGGGSQGGGTYDVLGPSSAGGGFRPAKAGETISLYGIGFGATNPAVAPGQTYRCLATCATMVTNPTVTVGGVTVPLLFVGMVSAGLYQFNLTLPIGLGTGDQALEATVNGVQTPAGVFLPLQ